MMTPWGAADHVEQLFDGAVRVSTPSHGGIHLDSAANAAMPEALRVPSGWYEEDCEAALVVVGHRDHFSGAEVDAATSVVRNWFPDRFEAHFGVKLTAADSTVVAQRAFDDKHSEDLVTIAAWGSWHEAVPHGSVAVAATVGGDRSRTSQHFLVPASEYGSCADHFVVNPQRHTRVDSELF